MPLKTPAKPGCFTRLVGWGIGGIALLVACSVIANLLPSTESPDRPTVMPNAIAETRPAEIVAPTNTTPPPETTAPTVALVATRPPAPTNAATPLPTLTSVPTATAIPPTNTLPPLTSTPLPQTTANQDANLRGGPGTNYPVTGGVAPGQALVVVATSPDREWLQLDNGAWIAAFLVSNQPVELPVAASIPIAPAPSTDTPVPIVVEVSPTAPPAPTATPVPAAPQPANNCDPSYPDFCLEPGLSDLDCKDIPYGRFRVLPPDPHGFDGNDNDGLGCESN